MTELEEFRKQKDIFLSTDRHSPLTAGQRKDFKGLEYFPENPDLRLEVDVEELPEKHTVEMQTSTGSVQSYIRYGTFKFNVDGQQAEFTLFSDRHGFFLPFVLDKFQPLDDLPPTGLDPLARRLEVARLRAHFDSVEDRTGLGLQEQFGHIARPQPKDSSVQ